MSDKPTAVRVYLARVRTSLADLPPTEVEEILDDVRPHLAEIEAEMGPGARVDALIERLGTPESYAAELRASGGYPPVAETVVAASTTVTKSAPGRAQPRIALWGLVLCTIWAGGVAFVAGHMLNPDVLLILLFAAPVFLVSIVLVLHVGVARVRALPEVKWLVATLDRAREQESAAKTMRFLGTLKPAWWVVCAVALAAFGLLLMARHRQAVLLLPFLIAIGLAAVWAGQRVRGDRRLVWMVAPVSAFVVGGLFGGFGATVDLIGDRTPYATASSNSPTSGQYGNGELRYRGSGVENIYAFDAEGKPLTDIYLYDEKGEPITLPRYGCRTPNGGETKSGEDNRFPRPRIEMTQQPSSDAPGAYTTYETVCRETAGVPFSAAIPKSTTSSSPPVSTTPSAPSPTPSVTSSAPPPSSPSSPSRPTPTK
ncbi:hypothetical protein ALI144C_18830 [Actinosynnema sp. ALI-1.44]|uniref:DUF1700 domain-containing protein n=1 Tax=Actinosynnema sp. ALI-1.44 TaxID=1933779 RepID=UPI00097BBAF9|nr:hypothetical protein [Actinosynnema sp. ALI-1.44]ONI81398.1 hypothetical protein ALI144C_18830 [Actinosynnema sp. ALI-1.44]